MKTEILLSLCTFALISSAQAQECQTRDSKGKECTTAHQWLDTTSPTWNVPTIDVHNGCGCRCIFTAEKSGGTEDGRKSSQIVDSYSDDKIICIWQKDGSGCHGFKEIVAVECHPINSGSTTSIQIKPLPSTQANTEKAGTGTNQSGATAAGHGSELLDFDEAQSSDSIARWEAYLNDHPTGEHADWARKRIKELKDKAAALAPSIKNDIHLTGTYSFIKTYNTVGFNWHNGNTYRGDVTWSFETYAANQLGVMTAGKVSINCSLNSEQPNADSGAEGTGTVWCSYSRNESGIVVSRRQEGHSNRWSNIGDSGRTQIIMRLFPNSSCSLSLTGNGNGDKPIISPNGTLQSVGHWTFEIRSTNSTCVVNAE